jgi:tetratricopeptide (TPR) repeat protein
MPATPLGSERDREILRSFARRIDPSDAGAHNNLGVLYFNKGLYEDAVQAFMRALELDPRMQVAQRNLEIAYFNTGYYDERVPELRDRVRADPADRQARWELARTYALLGEHANAVEEFQALLRYAPNDVGAVLQLGLAERALEHADQAQQWLEKARALDPNSSLVHFYLGEIAYNRGLNEEALASLDRAVELNPENHDALYLMGFVLGDLGRQNEANAVTKRAIKLNPMLSRAQANLSLDQNKPERYEAMVGARAERRSRRMEVSQEGLLAHYNLGLAFRQKGYYSEALREYRLALDRGEDEDLVCQAMAEVHLVTRDVGAALTLYDALLARTAGSPKLWNERGVALHQDGRYREAEESYRRAIAADAGYALAHNNLGVALYQAGNGDAAVSEFRAALDTHPGLAKARLNLALLLYRAKRLQTALEAYRQVLATDPEHPVAWNGVGLVLADLRKYEDARNAFARAIQARPEYAEAHYNLSFTLSNLGDFEGALRETKLALELEPYYVAQKFELAIDLQYEDPDLSIQPDIGGESRTDAGIQEFEFDTGVLDSVFTQLTPAPESMPAVPSDTDPYGLAVDYLTKGFFDRAQVEARRALAHGADRTAGNVVLGETFAQQGLFGEALERFRAARRETPDDLAAMHGEAQALWRLGQAAEAVPIVEALILRASENIEVLMLAAGVRAAAGDPAAALATLDTARRVAPMRPDVHQQMGDIARRLGDLEGAILAYRHALELDPQFAGVRYELARLLVEKRQFREAEAELLSALDAVPTYAEATLELATLRRMTGRADDALPLLIDLLQRDPYHFDPLIALGETLLVLGRKDDAVKAFTRVLRFDPNHVGALYHEGVLLAERRRYREAIERWERVLTLAPSGGYARRARREIRSARDLQRIFSDRTTD